MKFKTKEVEIQPSAYVWIRERQYVGALPRLLQWTGLLRPPHEVGEFKPREGWLVEDQLVLTGTCIEAVPRWFPRLRDWATRAIAWVKARLEPVPEPTLPPPDEDDDDYWG